MARHTFVMKFAHVFVAIGRWGISEKRSLRPLVYSRNLISAIVRRFKKRVGLTPQVAQFLPTIDRGNGCWTTGFFSEYIIIGRVEEM